MTNMNKDRHQTLSQVFWGVLSLYWYCEIQIYLIRMYSQHQSFEIWKMEKCASVPLAFMCANSAHSCCWCMCACIICWPLPGSLTSSEPRYFCEWGDLSGWSSAVTLVWHRLEEAPRVWRDSLTPPPITPPPPLPPLTFLKFTSHQPTAATPRNWT